MKKSILLLCLAIALAAPTALEATETSYLSQAEILQSNANNARIVKPVDIWYRTANGYLLHIHGSLKISLDFSFAFNGYISIIGNGINISFPVNYNPLDDSGTLAVYSEEGENSVAVANGLYWETTSYPANTILNTLDVEAFVLSEFNDDCYTDPIEE